MRNAGKALIGIAGAAMVGIALTSNYADIKRTRRRHSVHHGGHEGLMTSRILLIDSSGGIPRQEMVRIQSLIQVGDRVIMFDTDPMDRGFLNSREEIDDLRWTGGGGTMLSKTLQLVASLGLGLPVSVVTDGYIYDAKQAGDLARRQDINITDVIPFEGSNPSAIEELKKELIL